MKDINLADESMKYVASDDVAACPSHIWWHFGP
jgi:hypothetical protein